MRHELVHPVDGRLQAVLGMVDVRVEILQHDRVLVRLGPNQLRLRAQRVQRRADLVQRLVLVREKKLLLLLLPLLVWKLLLLVPI